MTTLKANMRKGGRYAEARDWAFALIGQQADGISSSEMSDLMVEQFKDRGFRKGAMSHCLSGMVKNGVLRRTGKTIYKGKPTFTLVAVKRAQRRNKQAHVDNGAPASVPTSVPGDVSLAVTLTFTDASGEPLVVTATIAEAKAAYKSLHAIFGPGVL